MDTKKLERLQTFSARDCYNRCKLSCKDRMKCKLGKEELDFEDANWTKFLNILNGNKKLRMGITFLFIVACLPTLIFHMVLNYKYFTLDPDDSDESADFVQ